MTQNYIGINGIVTQDLNSILAELQDNLKGIYGDNINLESNTADGQWLNILAQQKIDALDFQVQLYNNLDVDSVVGLPQQVLYKLNGLTIKDFTYSWVYVNVTVTQNVTLSGLDADIANVDGTGYTVSDINGNNWILAESISLVQSETPYLLLFRAQELGQVTALANTITTMSTIVAGVTEVNNPANNFITGQTGETAAEFRTRRNRSLQTPSQGFKESIEGQLLALNDVSDAKVYDNKDNANIDGVQVIVQGGTSNEIGNIIYNNLPPGINTQGAYQATITVNNRDKVLNYDKPNPIPILVKGTIESLTGYPNDIDLDYVKRTLASRQFNISEIAESANITTELKNILGETGSPYDVELSVGMSGGEWELQEAITANNLNSIVYMGNKFVVCGASGYFATSTDLETWDVQTVGSNGWNGIKYLNEMYVMYGAQDKIATSTDLETWTVQTIGNASTSTDSWVGADVTSFDDSIIALSRNGRVAKYENSSWSVIATISAGANLSGIIEVTTGTTITSGALLAVGNGKIVMSSSGQYWGSVYNLKYNTREVYVQQIKNVNGKVVCVGYIPGTGLVGVANFDNVSSTDANNITWEWTELGTTLFDITYANGLYIVVGGNGFIAMSEDFTNWSTQSIGNAWRGVAGSSTTYAAIGWSGSLTTYDLPTPVWEEILTPTGLADFYVMTVAGMDNLTVLGAE